MKKSEIQARVKQYKTLAQFKDKSEEELFELAKKSLEQEEKQGLAVGLYIGKEKKKAKELFSKYINEYHLESVSDITLLNTRIFFEILTDRIQARLTELQKKNLPPDGSDLKNLIEINKQILDLDRSLGFLEDKQKDYSEIWELLKEKLRLYANENKGAFYFQCPHCGEMTLLLKKIDDYNAFDWNMFRGTFVYNEALFNMIEQKRMTIEEVASIFGCSSDYIQGIYNNVYLKDKTKEAK